MSGFVDLGSEPGDGLAGRYTAASDRVTEFYVPLLQRAVRYDRAAGYFNSGGLAAAAQGLAHFVTTGGTMRLIVGAELTEAVARLLERSGSPERAARLLRADLHRRLTTRLGAPVGMSAQALSEVVASRTGVDATQVYAVLAQSPIGTDDDLVHLATQAARLRAAVDGGTNLQPTDDLREVATP